MKNFIALIALSVCVFQSCDNDNDPTPSYVSTAATSAFTSQYPSAADAEWETRNDYLVVDFEQGGVDMEAWYDSDGNWYMTETDIPYSQLPGAVKSAIQASDYATWTVDDVDKIERKDTETIYVVEVEQGNNDVDLYYTADGVLVKTVVNSGSAADGSSSSDSGSSSGSSSGSGSGTGSGSNEDFLPSTSSSTIESYITTNYPSARIVEIDNEDGQIEVEILDGTVLRELTFSSNGTWVQTKTELRSSSLPTAVSTAIAASQYASYRIDDIDFIQTTTGEWYLIELESGNREVTVRISATGEFL